MKKIIALSTIALFLMGCGANVDPNNAPKTDEPTGNPMFELACTNGMSEFKVPDTTLEFCYNPAWGEPALEKLEGDAGNKFHLSFLNSENGIDIYYETKDYKAPEGGFTFNYAELRMTASEDSIKEQIIELFGLPAETDIKVRKMDVSGKRAARVDYKDEITYYVPDAFANYNLMFKAPKTMAVEIDELAFDMVMN